MVVIIFVECLLILYQGPVRVTSISLLSLKSLGGLDFSAANDSGVASKKLINKTDVAERRFTFIRSLTCNSSIGSVLLNRIPEFENMVKISTQYAFLWWSGL